MKKRSKKTDQNEPWNRRKALKSHYQLRSLEPNTKRFLIICEGENTEPYYFKSFPVITAQVETLGLGQSKTTLVKSAITRVRQESPDPEREVWIVFDMDIDPDKAEALQRGDFNEAIRLARKEGFNVAYSNDAFDLWFVLHYDLLEVAVTRGVYYEFLSSRWSINYQRQGKKVAFCQSIYQRLRDDPQADQSSAIRRAKRLMDQWIDEEPAYRNPCTTVFELVEKLNKYLIKK